MRGIEIGVIESKESDFSGTVDASAYLGTDRFTVSTQSNEPEYGRTNVEKSGIYQTKIFKNRVWIEFTIQQCMSSIQLCSIGRRPNATLCTFQDGSIEATRPSVRRYDRIIIYEAVIQSCDRKL